MGKFVAKACLIVFALCLHIMPAGFVGAASAQEQDAKASATSPDGTITLDFYVNRDGYPQYSVTRRGTPIIAPSMLGFQFTDQYPMERFFTFDSFEKGQSNTSWEQPWGERKTVVDHHNELLVKIHDEGALGKNKRRNLAIRFRVFNNGVAFRYEFPDQGKGKSWNIMDELTEFNIAQNGKAWWQNAGNRDRYEYLYENTAIDGVATAQTPATMRLDDGTHLAFHEAALVDYAGYWLSRIDGLKFRTRLAPSTTGPKVSRKGAFNTPWRAIRIADNAAGLYDNDLELNLNEPNKLGDVSWVKPMKFMGIWWGMFLEEFTWSTGPKHGATTANAKRYIDAASKFGIDALLIEGWNKGWDGRWYGDGRDFNFTEATPDFDIEAVAAYAKEKGVKMLGHHETGGNIKVYEPQMEAGMALYERLGYAGIKTGYVANAGGIIAPGAKKGEEQYLWHDGQAMQRHHIRVLETAAKHRLTIDTHEPIKDTGLRRTYPNWIAREGSRGMEYSAGYGGQNPPSHEPTLIFTRMLSGPMDYTPGILSLEVKDGKPLPSTMARQLGLYVTLYSPLQMVADTVQQLERFPQEMAFIRTIPTDWAETHTLMGEVGRMAVIARKDRNSENWFVGGVTNEDAFDARVDLKFLPAGQEFKATIWRDADDADFRTETRHKVVAETRVVTSKDFLQIRMAPGGGFAVRLEK